MPSLTKVRLRTHAKLNLFLRVLGRRPDGYHELETIFHGIDLHDEIEIEPTQTGRVEIEMQAGPDFVGTLPELEDNLIWRIAQVLLDRGANNSGVRIAVTKNIPIGAGLGGGSGNAAGVLLALDELWAMGLQRDAILGAAASVGSDVAYCIGGGTALAMGRGEALTPLPSQEQMHFVVGISNDPISTAAVYDAWDELEPVKSEVRSAPMTLALGAGDATEVAGLLHNDLEAAALVLRPNLHEAKSAMVEAGALGACMTGSGPTIFGLCRDAGHAREVGARVAGAFDRIALASSKSQCVEFLDA